MSHKFLACLLAGSCLLFSNIAAGDEPDNKPVLPAKHKLQPVTIAGDSSVVSVRIEAGGDLKVKDQGKPRTIKMSVLGELGYEEKLLRCEGTARSAARSYQVARANIKIDGVETIPTLREKVRLIAAEADAAGNRLFCPAGPLTRDELDLIDVPVNSLSIDSLLPSHDVAQGETWKLPDESVQSLLNLDAVSSSDVECTFTEIEGGKKALVKFFGHIEGAVQGVATEIELKGQYGFDMERRRINVLAVLIKEQRPIGHTGPGLEVVAQVQMTMKPLEAATTITTELIEQHAWASTPDSLRLLYQPSQASCQMLADRRWHLVSDTPELAIWRYIDRGELVAQCNLALQPSTKAVTLGNFQAEIQKGLGEQFERFLEASQKPRDGGGRALRVTVEGHVSELPIQWHYYRVEAEDGRAVTLAFLLESALRERFADADQPFVESVVFPDQKPSTATAPKRLKLSR